MLSFKLYQGIDAHAYFIHFLQTLLSKYCSTIYYKHIVIIFFMKFYTLHIRVK